MRRRLPPALRIRDFALLWASLFSSGVAFQMLAVAIGWQVYSIHHNPLDLGLVGLMEFLPLPLLALPAGQIADRLPRRAVTAGALVLNIAIALLLVVVTLTGARSLWPFLAIAAVAGTASVVGNPAMRALTPELVPHELLPGALALRGVAGQVGLISGPALGGIIFAIKPVAVYASAAGLLTLSLAAVLAMRPVVRSLVTTERPGWDSLVAGVRFIVRTRMLLGAIGLIAPAVTGTLPGLVSLAALGLAIVSGAATVYHMRHDEPPAPIAFLVLALGLAYVRWRVVPL